MTVIDAVVRMRPDMGGTLSSLSLIERGFALAIPLALAGTTAALVKMGMDAQTQLSIVQGLTGSTAAQMQYYTTALEGMGARFGMTLDESAKGLYYVVSAGFKGADAINVLTTAMQHSAATGAPLQDVANGLTSAMNSYGASANQAAYYSDIMTTAITYGKQTTEDFAASVSKASLMASIAGVPFNQLAAAESALTEKGEPAARAFTELRFLMSKTALGAYDVGNAVRKAGGQFDDAKYQTLDLAGKLLYLRDNTGLTIDQLLKVVGGTRSAQGAFGLLVDSGKAYNNILDKMRHDSGVTAAAFEIHTHTMQYAFDQVKASVSNAGYELVKMVSPAVIPFLQGIAAAAGHLPDLFRAIGSVLGDTVTKVDGPMQTFGKHTGDVSQILNTHKGLLSQVKDVLMGQVIPAIIQLATWVRVNVLPALVTFAGVIQTSVVPVVLTLASVVRNNILPALAQIWTSIAQNLLPALEHWWGILSTILVPVLQALGWVLQHIVGPALALIITIIGHLIDFMATVIGWVGNFIGKVRELAGWLGTALAPAFHNVNAKLGELHAWFEAKVLPILRTLWAYFHANILPVLQLVGGMIRDQVVANLAILWDILSHKVLPILQAVGSFLVNGIGADFYTFGAAIDYILTKIGDMLRALGHLKDLLGSIHLPDFGGIHIPGHAAGGMASGLSLVGEQGPELAIFPTGTQIVPAAQTAAILGGGGGGGSQQIVIHNHHHLYIDGKETATRLVPHMMAPMVSEIRRATGLRI